MSSLTIEQMPKVGLGTWKMPSAVSYCESDEVAQHFSFLSSYRKQEIWFMRPSSPV